MSEAGSISSEKSEDFYRLTPHVMLEALEEQGLVPNGYITPLNSYENRVMFVGLEDDSLKSVVAKFYRPGRWSKEAIQDEHDFIKELKSEGIPAVAALPFQSGETVAEKQGIYFSVFPRIAGRSPQEFLGDELKQVGRRLAQIHNIGARKEAKHRLTLNAQTFGEAALDVLQKWVTPELWIRYEEASLAILDFLDDEMDENDFIRIHGDCHRGNLLHDGKEFFFVDFDDFVNGPAVQDFWMLFGGDEDEASRDRDLILSGYEELRDVDSRELDLLEPLRGLRIVHYAAWIARRWQDPSFPKLFPHFNSYNYWLEEVERLDRIALALP